MSSINPNAEQFAAFTQSSLEGEVVMLNLLKFEVEADGATGEQVYERYGQTARRLVEERGGRVLWAGRACHVFIGDVDANDYDVVVLVSYPSRDAFLEMVSTAEYREAARDREAGLSRTVLIACEPSDEFRG